MSTPIALPNRLSVKDGVLTMRDGSSVQEYLRNRPIANEEEVSILPRATVEQLVHDAREWHFHKQRLMAADERFAFAA